MDVSTSSGGLADEQRWRSMMAGRILEQGEQRRLQYADENKARGPEREQERRYSPRWPPADSRRRVKGKRSRREEEVAGDRSPPREPPNCGRSRRRLALAGELQTAAIVARWRDLISNLVELSGGFVKKN